MPDGISDGTIDRVEWRLEIGEDDESLKTRQRLVQEGATSCLGRGGELLNERSLLCGRQTGLYEWH